VTNTQGGDDLTFRACTPGPFGGGVVLGARATLDLVAHGPETRQQKRAEPSRIGAPGSRARVPTTGRTRPGSGRTGIVGAFNFLSAAGTSIEPGSSHTRWHRWTAHFRPTPREAPGGPRSGSGRAQPERTEQGGAQRAGEDRREAGKRADARDSDDRGGSRQDEWSDRSRLPRLRR
jgi:hypothetical protein